MSQGWDKQFDEVARLHREHMDIIAAAKDIGPPMVKTVLTAPTEKGNRHQRRAAARKAKP